ncbi:MAG: hypothetical protein Q8Q81_09430 [Oxalobacteraceae bacterium]|nr:hypothetical protein [Oxalobacteraceae bacterium]
MLNPFIDHSFKKIGDYSASRDFAASSAKQTLKQLDAVLEKFRSSGHGEEGENLLEYRTVKRALEQCLRHIEAPNQDVTIEDHTIYFQFAYDTLQKAEEVIDADYFELGL